jgi:hypothetical protein
MRWALVGMVALGMIAQAQPVPRELERRTSQFFKLLMAGEIEQAYEQLAEGNPQRDSLWLEQLCERTRQFQCRHGLPLGWELLRAEWHGKALLRLECLEYYDALPLRWELLFYRSPRRGWLLLQLRMEERPEALLRRAE